MIHAAVDEVEANYKGLVIGNQGKISVLVRTRNDANGSTG